MRTGRSSPPLWVHRWKSRSAFTRVKRGMQLVKFRAVDDSGSVDITFFNQAWVRDQIHAGESYIFYGKLSGTLTRRTMANPDWEPELREGQKTGRILPRYPLCHGISNKQIMGYVRTALDKIGDALPDVLPPEICTSPGSSSAVGWGAARIQGASPSLPAFSTSTRSPSAGRQP